MRLEVIERPADAFQQPVSQRQLEAMCRRAFGPVTVAAAVELGLGAYNSTFRISIDGRDDVILRVAPEPGRQFRSERELMRNEVASVELLAPISALLPRNLFVDFSHSVVGRDYLLQSVLPGVPAPEGLQAYPRSEWPPFFRQLGTITRAVHTVTGSRFGPVAGPTFVTWSEALAAYFVEAAMDVRRAGVEASDVDAVVSAIGRHRSVLDEITHPRLLHGDLWTVNVMVAPDAPEPMITGVCDCDRTWWGDPLADWTIDRAGLRPGTERDAFWDTYGALPASPAATLRSHIYRARHVVAMRLERLRLGNQGELGDTYDELRGLLAEL